MKDCEIRSFHSFIPSGADTEKDDGIYSAYFMGFTGDGVYKVTLEVENQAVGQAKKITFPYALSGVMPQNWSKNGFASQHFIKSITKLLRHNYNKLILWNQTLNCNGLIP